MATITTLRPSATTSGTGWSASPSGTLHGVTSDDSDASAALWSGAGSSMVLATPADTPPVGESRHLCRLRARGEDGSAWWAVRLSSGGLIAAASAEFTASPTTVSGSWQAGLPATGSTVLSAHVEGQTSGVRIVELYLDVDSRLAPTFALQILDGSGSSTTTVADTTTPTVHANAVNFDGLVANQYRYWVTLDGATAWDTGVVSGSPINRQTAALANGSYTAHAQIWSTLGTSTAYASDVEELDFDISVGVVDPPTVPTVTAELPFYRIEVCAPDVSGFDNYVGYVELQRLSCSDGGYLELPGVSGSFASTPDHAGLDITGDLQVTIFAQRDDGWRPNADENLVSKYFTVGNQRSWRISLDADGDGEPARGGRPFITWSPDGMLPVLTAVADDRMEIDALGNAYIRVFLDVDNGAGGWTVYFETVDATGEWIPIGNPVTGAGVTSIFASTTNLAVGAHANGTGENFNGNVYSVEVRAGQNGAVVASPDFTDHPLGTTSFVDAQGNVWSTHGSAAIISTQTAETIAVIGPLTTDECGEWVDWSSPRMGLGESCETNGEMCCSSYRARTVGLVDGAILISDWSSNPEDTFCMEWDQDYILIRTLDEDGPFYVQVVGMIDWDVSRPFTVATGVSGSRFVTSASPGGRNFRMTAAVESESTLTDLRDTLERPLVLISPSDSTETWAAPISESVRITKVGRIRRLEVDMIATGPEPGPLLEDLT